MSYTATYIYSITVNNTCCAQSGAAGSKNLQANFTLLDDTGSKINGGVNGGQIGRINRVGVKQIHTWTSKPGYTDYWFTGTVFGTDITGDKNNTNLDSNNGSAGRIWSYCNTSYAPLNQTPISNITIRWGKFSSSSNMYWRSVSGSDNLYRIRVTIEYDFLDDVQPYNYTYTSSFNTPSGKSPIGGFHTATITCAKAENEGAGLAATGFNYVIEDSSGNQLLSSSTTDTTITVANSYLSKGKNGTLKVKITPTNLYGSGTQQTVSLTYKNLGGSFPAYSSSNTPFFEDSSLTTPINYNNSVLCFLATEKSNYVKIGATVTNQGYDYYYKMTWTKNGTSSSLTAAKNYKYFSISADWNDLINITELECIITVTDTSGNSLGTVTYSRAYSIPTLKIGTNVVLGIGDVDYKNTTQSTTSSTILAGKILTLTLTGASSEYSKCVLTATIGDENITKTLTLSSNKVEYSFGINNSPTFPVSTIKNKTLTKVSFSFQNSSGVKQYFKYGESDTPISDYTISYSNTKFMNNWGLTIGFEGDVTSYKFYRSGKFNFTLDKVNNTDISLAIKANNNNISNGAEVLYNNTILSGLTANQKSNISITSGSLYGYTIDSTTVTVYKLSRISLSIPSAPTTMELYKKWDENGSPTYNSISFSVSHTTSSEVTYTRNHSFSNSKFTTSSGEDGVSQTITITTKSGVAAGDTITYTYSVSIKVGDKIIETLTKSVTITVKNEGMSPFHKKTDSAYAINYIRTNDTNYYISGLTEIYIKDLKNSFSFQPESYQSNASVSLALDGTENLSGAKSVLNYTSLSTEDLAIKLPNNPSIGSAIYAHSYVTADNKTSDTHNFNVKGKEEKNNNLIYNEFKISKCSINNLTAGSDSVSMELTLGYALSNSLSNIKLSDFYIKLESEIVGSQTNTTNSINFEVNFETNSATITKTFILDFSEEKALKFFKENSNFNISVTPKLYCKNVVHQNSAGEGVIYTFSTVTSQLVTDSPDLALRKNCVAINRNPSVDPDNSDAKVWLSAIEVALAENQKYFLGFFNSGDMIGAFSRSEDKKDVILSCGEWDNKKMGTD